MRLTEDNFIESMFITVLVDFFRVDYSLSWLRCGCRPVEFVVNRTTSFFRVIEAVSLWNMLKLHMLVTSYQWLGSGLRDHLWDESVLSLAIPLFKPYLTLIPLESCSPVVLNSSSTDLAQAYTRIRPWVVLNLESVELWLMILKFGSGGF